MKLHTSAAGIFLAGVIVLICAGSATPLWAQAPTSKPSPKVIILDAHGGDYLQLLGGAPESVTMRSGLVILAPQHSVGKHSTGRNEEILIVLAGKGEMMFKDKPSLTTNGTLRDAFRRRHRNAMLANVSFARSFANVVRNALFITIDVGVVVHTP